MKRQADLTPVERWIISSIGAVVGLGALGATTFWLWNPPWEQCGVIVFAVWVAYKWGEAIGTSREQLLQDERARRHRMLDEIEGRQPIDEIEARRREQRIAEIRGDSDPSD